MRPYLVLLALALVPFAAFGQDVIRNPGPVYGPCMLGCGPFVPLVTTPMVSLQQVSPNPVGASNATTGLVAGATNSTLSQLSGNTNSVSTQAVWYQGGGAPLTSSSIHLWPEPLTRPAHPMMHAMMMEHHGEQAQAQWIYFSGTEYTANAVESSAAAKSGKKAARTYTNADVERQNQNNGNVKYNGKTEKM